MKKKVSIIGSCVSRDSFNSINVENYSRFFETEVYQSQMSFISLMNKPVEFDISNSTFEGMTFFDKNQLITEMTKQVLYDLSSGYSDYLIIDFYGDLFYGVVKTKCGSFLTNKKWSFIKSNIFSESISEGEILSIETNLEEYLSIWYKHIDLFFSYKKINFPNTKIILNCPKFIENFIDAEGNEKSVAAVMGIEKDVNFLNSIIERMKNYVLDKHEVTLIDYSDFDYYLDENHIYGVHYLHYEKRFYTDFRDKLLQIALQESTSIRKVENEMNLIRNGDFENGNSYWAHWNENFNVVDNIVTIRQEKHDKNMFFQCWSNAFHVIKNRTYKIEFEVKVNEDIVLDDLRIFSIRVFNGQLAHSQKDSVQYVYLSLDSDNSYEWKKIKYEFTVLDGKFCKVGMFLFKNGSVDFRNISVFLK